MSRSRIIIITTAAGFTLACSGASIIDPPPSEPKTTLFQNPDGTCSVNVPYECPPPEEGMTCNPPPILDEPCPPLENVREISRQPDGTCQAIGAFVCDEDWSCPGEGTAIQECPPQLGDADRIGTNYVYGCTLVTDDVRTQTADCPESMTRPMQANYRFEENADGTCTAWYTGEMHCPEGASCNPPPPAEVACPPNAIPPMPG